MAPASLSKRRAVPSATAPSVSTRPEVLTGATKDVQRSPMDEPIPRYSQLFKLSIRLHCLLGGPLLNVQEEIILSIMILGMIALVAAGAFKQITKLTDGLPA